MSANLLSFNSTSCSHPTSCSHSTSSFQLVQGRRSTTKQILHQGSRYVRNGGHGDKTTIWAWLSAVKDWETLAFEDI